MGVSLRDLGEADPAAVAATIRDAGIAGAGGAGFPTHAKWARLDEVSYLLVNHEESEPNYYMDKWLGREHAERFAALFDALLGAALDAVVVGTKETYRDRWMGEFEAATDAAVFPPEDLPLDPAAVSDVAVAYTADRYEYGMESVLLRLVADVVIRGDLPMDHGWIVQNTETLDNIYRALAAGEPVTRKYVHVDGDVPRHRFLEVPVGTTPARLLDAAGASADLGDDRVLADGGPGWCFEIDDPDAFGVTKRTNGVLALDADLVAENTLGDERINVLNAHEWKREHETEPTTLTPDLVRVPLITNPDFGDVVVPSEPIVESGDRVTRGDPIAVPGEGGISNTQHASIDGRVTDVTGTYVEIRR